MSDFDPREVPILGELEDEYRRMVGEAFAPAPMLAGATGAGAAARPAAPAPDVPAAARRPREPWLRTGRRILGRAAVAGALVGVVGATALATKSVVGRDPAASGPVVLERTGGRKVALRHYQGKLCLDVSFAAGVATRCTRAPGAGEVAPLSAETPDGRVVAGLAGDGVERLRVRSGGRTVEVATRRVGRGADGALRWFSAVLPAPAPGHAPAAVVLLPRGAGGAAAGRAIADCTLGSVASCRAARAGAAREHR